jgi:hypothetical protein
MIFIVPVFVAFFFVSPAIVAAILLSPYITTYFKRLRMLKHLYKTAELCGYRVRHLHKWVSFSTNRADCYDLLIENSERAYVIKLWSAKNKEKTLTINKDGTFYESSLVPGGLSVQEHYVVTDKPKSVPVTRSNFKVKRTKTLELVMLYYPENERVLIDLKDKIVPLAEGDIVFGKRVFTPETLKKLLRRYRVDRSNQ